MDRVKKLKTQLTVVLVTAVAIAMFGGVVYAATSYGTDGKIKADETTIELWNDPEGEGDDSGIRRFWMDQRGELHVHSNLVPEGTRGICSLGMAHKPWEEVHAGYYGLWDDTETVTTNATIETDSTGSVIIQLGG